MQLLRIPSTTCLTVKWLTMMMMMVTIALLPDFTRRLLCRSASVSSNTAIRWFYPCSGSTPIADMGPATEDDTQSAINMQSTFHALSLRSIKLKRRVRDLKNQYIEKRFRDESIVNDLEQMGLHLEGMPTIQTPTISSVSHSEVVPTIHSAFEHLARVAVFLDQARIGETVAVNEPTSFERDFQRIEDHHEDGLYWILCALHQIIRNTGTEVSVDVITSIMNMKVTEVDRNAMRHTRDFIVLRDFEKILDRLSILFASLKNLHNTKQQPQKL